MKFFYKFLKWSALLLFVGVLSVLLINFLVVKSTEDYIFNDPKTVPFNKVGLLLGTSKRVSSGNTNLYYKYRIDAAVKLYQSEKVEYILVSGDNGTLNYDEPTTIKNDLIKRGIPTSKIFLDYAGFRTLDSVIRSRAVFGQKRITVISQQFHNERAIYIAKSKGIKAVGFNAQDVSKRYGKKTMLRERFARVKMVLDLIFGKSPKFLGDKVKIE